MGLKLKVKKSVQIEDGMHKGEIIEVKKSENTEFNYIDVVITLDDLKKEDGSPFTLRYGCPANLSALSKLGRLLTAVGVDLEENKEIDVEKELLHKKISYMTVTENTKDGSFARIVPESIKLL
ncbi:MAG: hypothetical protein J7L15_08850 [Clostridiales bacterium]|nr:hypothetical protein [Clostridiales bacterium]